MAMLENTLRHLCQCHPAMRGINRRPIMRDISSQLPILSLSQTNRHYVHNHKSPHKSIFVHYSSSSQHGDLSKSVHLTKTKYPLLQSNYSSPLMKNRETFQTNPLRTTDQRVLIHQQPVQGRKQADRHFILTGKGMFEASPKSLKPYLSLIRLDRPIGTWLLFLPCTWSISLAAAPGCLPDLTMLALFAVGSFFMRGAGCTINDMWDKEYDAKVARTKGRPLASGQITSFRALSFLGLQLSGALCILLTMNWPTIFLGCCAMIPVIVYPLMKRITYWPQAFLGLTFNWGTIMGWSAIQGSPDLSVCLPLYASGIAWTLVYDTIYAHQDKDDDILIGVKSTALKLGDATKPWLWGFSGVMVTGLTLCGVMCEQTWPYYVGVSAVLAHLSHQIYTVDLNSTDDCSKMFRSNRNLGIMFWLAIMAGTLLKKKKDEQKEEETQCASL